MERRGAGSHCGRPDSGASQLTGDGRRDRYQPLQARPSQQERGHRKEAPGNRQANRQAHGAVQHDDIPPELLGERINKLYNERTALESTLAPVVEDEAMPFDLVEALISDAAQVWDFADESQKRRILQSLVSRIVLTDDDVKIEWAF